MNALTDQQVEAVLQESLHRGFFELDVDGNLPRDPEDRRKAAEELLRQTRLSYRAGNRTDGVVALLYLAEDDLVTGNQPDTGGNMAATAEVDLAQYDLPTLQKFAQTLENYEPGEERDQNLALVRAEIARKGGAAPVSTPAPVVEAVQEQVPPQAIEAAVHAAQDEEIRNSLIDQITFGMMRAHGIDPSDMPNLPIERLQEVIANPTGAQETPAPAPVPEPAAPTIAPEPRSPVQTETIPGAIMVTTQPEPDPAHVMEQAELVKAGGAPQNGVSPEREVLESQVTGPMLKAYGRGRVDVPEIGDNELRFMIENPEGRVTQDQLLAARLKDQGQVEVVAEITVTQEEPTPQPSAGYQGPPSNAPSSAQTDPEPVAAESSVSPAEASGPSDPSTSPASSVPSEWVVKVPVQIDFPTMANPADEIIARENLPVPDEIEGTPRIPADMSTLTKQELYGVHGRFHAIESRANVLICDIEDKVFDLERLLKGTEAQVEASLPAKDGRTKITDAQRAAMVAADPRVQAIKERLHLEQKPLRKLKVLRDSYHKTVERASRQMNRLEQEREGAR